MVGQPRILPSAAETNKGGVGCHAGDPAEALTVASALQCTDVHLDADVHDFSSMCVWKCVHEQALMQTATSQVLFRKGFIPEVLECPTGDWPLTGSRC